MKKIVICCDGTGNQFGDRNSNVIKLYHALDLSAPDQVAYYHPGVGTMGDDRALTKAGQLWTKGIGLGFGFGLSENITDAYKFLMQHFEDGDEVYLFGFSRGAYTARALCGMLQMFGLLSRGNEGLIPYAIRLYKERYPRRFEHLRKTPGKFAIATGFKRTFGRTCKPHFLGVWDTVSSAGWFIDPFPRRSGSMPFTAQLKDVVNIRHAQALDERRAFFRQNSIDPRADGTLKQVWFAGVHSDVGGSYPEDESGLAHITLRWMLREAIASGLKVDALRASDILRHDAWQAAPVVTAMKHNSLTAGYWLLEFWPKFTSRLISAPGAMPPMWRGHPRMNLFRRRYLHDGACIHASVIERQRLDPSYKPKNLPKTYAIEPDIDSDPISRTLKVGESYTAGIFARSLFNDTSIQMHAGERYTLAASGTWYDSTTRCSAAGYASGTFSARRLERLRRSPHDNWFALIGTMDQDEKTKFLIGEKLDLTVTRDGTLHAFANDLRRFYFNNSGVVKLKITRVA